MNKTKYTYEILVEAVKNSKSFRDLSIRVGAGVHGGSIQLITDKVNKFNIDVSHFSGRQWRREFISNTKEPVEITLSIGKIQKAYKLKRALFEIGREYKCEICQLNTWMSKSLSLQIDHKDGNKTNNLADNLRFICPNCHSQTDNFCAKNIKK